MTLANRFFERAGKLADKWEHYLSIYEAELAPYLARGEPVRLLEIGVQNGGSLEFWSDYLPAHSQIVGIDIDPKVGELRFDNPNVSVIVHDATDREAMRPLLGDRVFDVVIDDGSHVCSEVIAAFELYIDYLAPGGKFFIEDLHTSYFASHGGGFQDPASSIEWLKRLIDVLNADHIQPQADPPGLFAMQRLNAMIGRVAFYDSVSVVEKLPVEKIRPYRRVFSGLETGVVQFDDWLFKPSLKSLEPILFAHPAARRVEASLLTELAKRRETIDELQAALARAAQEREAADAAAAAREAALHDEIAALRAPPEPVVEMLEPEIDDAPDLRARVLATAEG